jgi:WhiB family transcriptional regulator, redox-sensing transcriptional regulator
MTNHPGFIAPRADVDITPDMRAKIQDAIRRHTTVKRIAAAVGPVPAHQVREIGTEMGLHWDPLTGRMEHTAPPARARKGTARKTPSKPRTQEPPKLAPVPATGDPRWRERGACRRPGVDVDVFIGGTAADAAAARQVCRWCPVRGDCLDTAQARPEPAGVWGGTTADERLYLRRQARDRARRSAG